MSVQIKNPGQPATPEELRQLELSIGQKLPKDYVNYLRQYNGGHPDPPYFRIDWGAKHVPEGDRYGQVHYFYSAEEAAGEFEINRDMIPPGTLAIAGDPGRNLILLGVSPGLEGKVYFWDAENQVDWQSGEAPDFRNLGTVASSFSAFLASLQPRPRQR